MNWRNLWWRHWFSNQSGTILECKYIIFKRKILDQQSILHQPIICLSEGSRLNLEAQWWFVNTIPTIPYHHHTVPYTNWCNCTVWLIFTRVKCMWIWFLNRMMFHTAYFKASLKVGSMLLLSKKIIRCKLKCN